MHSKAPLTLTLPALMDGSLTCQLDPDPQTQGRLMIVSLETSRWTLDLLGVLGDVCPSLPEVLTGGYPIPLRGAALRASDSGGNLTDIVVTLDGRIFTGDAGTSFTCPPCLYEPDGGNSVIY